MALQYGAGRGKRIHIIRPLTLDNRMKEAYCGHRLDDILSYVPSREIICINCTRNLKREDYVQLPSPSI